MPRALLTPLALNNFQMSQGISFDEEKGTSPYIHPHGRSQSTESFPGDPEDHDDDSGDLYFMYSKMAASEDLWMAEHWQKSADSILIFTGLFSAAIAALLSISIQNLKENPQDISNFYLQSLIIAIETGFADLDLVPFSPTPKAVVVNLLWFLSLLISLTCAIMATVVQQWARQYIRYTQPSERGPKTRARIRAMFSHSADRLFIKCMTDLLPCYLHLAILLFLVGLLIFLFNLHIVIFAFAAGLFVFSMGLYGFFTLLPFFQHGSLLSTPTSRLSRSLWGFLVGVYCIVSRHRFDYDRRWGPLDWFFDDVGRKVDAITKARAPDIDIHVLDWSLRSLGDDEAVEKWLRAIPDFFRDPSAQLGPLNLESHDKLKQTLCGFLDRTLSSNSVTEDVRNSRLIVCLDASHASLGRLETLLILEDIRRGRWPKLLKSEKMGVSLTSWGNSSDEGYGLQIRNIVARIAAPPNNARR
ncbi:hypothetical protein BC827DRAFT_754757 [Russula dissimulans]|nr:hypothetical protein BC827DRAFT_754757 [Russula dissimulans]